MASFTTKLPPTTRYQYRTITGGGFLYAQRAIEEATTLSSEQQLEQFNKIPPELQETIKRYVILVEEGYTYLFTINAGRSNETLVFARLNPEPNTF